MTQPNALIRPATPEDAGALLAIYAHYVKDTAVSFEYEVPSPEEFRGRIEGTLRRYPYLVLEEDGLIRLRLSTKPGYRWKLNYLFLNCLKGY